MIFLKKKIFKKMSKTKNSKLKLARDHLNSKILYGKHVSITMRIRQFQKTNKMHFSLIK